MSKLVRDMYAEAEALRKERIRIIQERRRSGAAGPHQTAKVTRKTEIAKEIANG